MTQASWRDSVADFRPDAAGLQAAVARLVAIMQENGQAHPDGAVALPAHWPQEGVGAVAALDIVAEPALVAAARLSHPGFFAHMDPPTPWWTWATTLWAAATNQNLLHPDTGAAARAVEQAVVDWLAEPLGMAAGHITPGSSIANLTALWAARKQTGATTIVASQAAHLSIAKAADLLGMSLLTVPVNDRQQLQRDQLPADLSRAVLVLTAGTTATGALDTLVDRPHAAWCHVDAAWAGPLRYSAHAALLDGITTADSVALSAHKWLYQPKDSALVFFRDPAAQAAITFGSSYLAAPNVGVQGSHGAAAALSLAATLLAWGRGGVAARIEADLAKAVQFAALVEAEPQLELWRPPVSGVVNWRPRGRDPLAIRERLTAAWISTATIDGALWWRSVAANPAADAHVLLQQVRAALAAG